LADDVRGAQDPDYGRTDKSIDVGAKSEIYELAYELAKQNIASSYFFGADGGHPYRGQGRRHAGRAAADDLESEDCTEDKVLSYAMAAGTKGC
jgi:hypothetical protein